MKELVTVPEAARRLGIAPRTIRRAIQEGKLRAFRFGSRWNRVELAALETYKKTHLVEPAAARGRRRAREM